MVETRHKPIPWYKREAVRVRGYSVATAIIGLLVLREYITADEAGYILMAIAAIFGVYGIESSRNKTTADEVVLDEIVPAAEAGRTRRIKKLQRKRPAPAATKETDKDNAI